MNLLQYVYCYFYFVLIFYYLIEKKIENEDTIEKCTICLSEFEDCESVRYNYFLYT